MAKATKAKSSKSEKKNPTQARSVKTVDAILEASVRILKKFGPEGFNTNRIAEIAGVSVGSVYQFFGNKSAILDEVFGRFILESNKKIIEMILSEENGDLQAIIRRVVTGLFERFEAHNLLSAKVIEEVIQFGGLERFKKEEDRLSALILESLDRHQVQIGPKNRELALRLCIQSIRIWVTGYFVSQGQPGQPDRQAIIDEICEFVYLYLKPRGQLSELK